MKKNLFTIILLLLSTVMLAQGIYNNGGKIVIGSGVTLNIAGIGGNYRNESNVSDGTIDLSGTLIIAGNVTNNVVGADVLGTVAAGSEVVLSGTTLQTIGGATTSEFLFPNLTVNNSNGVAFTTNTQVNGNMTFARGLVDIGNNNFTFGPLAAVAGVPSAGSMIIATGRGQIKKSWSAIGAFTFPVGDYSITASYSPVTIDFKTGTFAAASFVGLNLAHTNVIDPSITGSYLNRYWTISQTGISGFTCDAVFQYQPSDITGIESSIHTLSVIPNSIIAYNLADVGLHQLNATGLNSFGIFTGGPGDHKLSLAVILEGAYNIGVHLMNTTLNTGNLIPLKQPYDVAPWDYDGTETVSAIPAGVVDWVLVEVRQAAAPELATSATILTKRAAFLLDNGNIVDLDGTSLLDIGRMPITQNLYPVVRHRNHLAIMSATNAPLNSDAYSYDFTTGLTQAFGGGVGYKLAGTASVMVASDVDKDGTINTSDYNGWALGFGTTTGYLNSDVDMDGNDNVSDYNKWAVNFGTTSGSMLKSAKATQKYFSSVPK